MPGYTDSVGGAPIGVANASYASFSPAANVTLQWPQYATTGQPFARLMDISPTAQGLTVALPDATLVSTGEAAIVNNKGAYAFNLLDNAGNVLAVVQPSEVRYVYLMDNSSVAGLWSMVLFGKSNSNQDASQFAGPGLKAINNTLAWAPVTTVIAGTSTLDITFRGKVVIWTGATGSINLPDLALVGNDFAFELRNQGSGVATLTPVSAQLIDGSANASFNLNESCLVHSSSTGWMTVGRGRSTQFAFTQLVKSVAGGGGTTTLSLTEAASVVQNYIGLLSGTQTVVFPAVVQVYYVSNQTTGGNNIVFKNPGSGSSISLAPGQNAVLFSDGTNVINANTTTTGLSALILGAGSAGAPVVSIGTASNGLYSPGTNQVGLALNGVGVVTWTVNGTTITAPSAAMSLIAPSGSATFVVDRVAAQTGSIRMRTAGADRFAWEVSNEPETGSDAGSNLALKSYNDAGTAGTVFSVARATGQVTFNLLPAASGSTMVTIAATQALTNKTIDGALNTLKNIDLGSQVTGVLPAANGGTGNQSGGSSGLTSINLASAQATGVLPISKGGTGSTLGVQGTVSMLRSISTSFTSGQLVVVGSPPLYYCDAAGNMGPFPIITSQRWQALSFIGAGNAGLWLNVP